MTKYILAFLLSLNITIGSAQDTLPIDDGRTIQIPVIIHIVPARKKHRVIERITNEIIMQELQELNQNYSATNDRSSLRNDFKNRVGNPNISFSLANVSLQEGEINGVIRHTRSVNPKRVSLLDPEKYVHIFIGKYTSSSFVLDGNTMPKRIKISYTSLGKSSQTITHEMGHYLGLWHVWGNTNCKKRKGPRATKTDSISDTPYQYNCTDKSRKKDCPPLDITVTPNYNNFMDYSKCRCFFTKEQAKTIRAKLLAYRKNLYDNSTPVTR
jgi:hypothetical protein